MDFEIEDIRRRLKILEGALGIDLDTFSKCSGEPSNCDADLCDETSCPMRNNIAQHAHHRLAKIETFIGEVQYLIARLVERGMIEKKDLDIASLKTKRDGQWNRLRLLEDAAAEAAGNDTLEQNLKIKLEKARMLLEATIRRIDELEGDIHDTTDPN